MTVASLNTKTIYQGNGVATVFAVPFKVLAGESHVRCRLVVNGEEAEVSNFIVNYSKDAVSVTYPAEGSPIPIDQELIIYRKTGLDQNIDLEEGGPFHAETHEYAFDKLTMQIQEVDEKVGRAILVGMSDGEPPDINGIYNEVKKYADQAEGYAGNAEAYANKAQGYVSESKGQAERAEYEADRAENAASSITGFSKNAHVFFGFTVDENFNLRLTKSEKGDNLRAADYDEWLVLPTQAAFSLQNGSLIMSLPFQPPYD